MTESDAIHAVDLIMHAMNRQEADWAIRAFDFYFSCQKNKIDSAREYYAAWCDEILCGLAGLHHYRWGPPDNVWLSWFAVHPRYQRQGLGSELINYIMDIANRQGYKKMLIETYSSEEFAVARNFYQRHGFEQTGKIERYIDDDIAMLVYSKRI